MARAHMLARFPWRWLVWLCIALFAGQAHFSEGCEFPAHFHGEFYGMERGEDVDVLVWSTGLTYGTLGDWTCTQIVEVYGDPESAYSTRILMHDEPANCYVCADMYYRTPNVIQITKGNCQTDKDVACREILPQNTWTIFFSKLPTAIDCRATFDGYVGLAYEQAHLATGPCASNESYIDACGWPGSPYVDNQVFKMRLASCEESEPDLLPETVLHCYGTWKDERGNKWIAVMLPWIDISRNRFKCLLTRDDEQNVDGSRMYSMSQWAHCHTLRSPYEGPIRFKTKPLYSTDVEARCSPPDTHLGAWVAPGKMHTGVTISASQVTIEVKINEFDIQEQRLTCIMKKENLHLMAAQDKGKCGMNYVCVQFSKREDNIAWWRVGPMVAASDTWWYLTEEERRQKIFLHACDAFTSGQGNSADDWDILLLNPPAAVQCPFGGHYDLVQTGLSILQYPSRYEGLPRGSNQPQCDQTMSQLLVCPRGSTNASITLHMSSCTAPMAEEKELPDRSIACIGHLSEGDSSYLFTYDADDAASPYRCWEYQRLKSGDIMAARDNGELCLKKMKLPEPSTVKGYEPLSMQLREQQQPEAHCSSWYEGKDSSSEGEEEGEGEGEGEEEIIYVDCS